MTDPIDTQIEKAFISKEKFAEGVENLVVKDNINYIDAIVEYCALNNIEIETVNKLVSKVLKEKLRAAATTLNYLEKTSQAKPIFK